MWGSEEKAELSGRRHAISLLVVPLTKRDFRRGKNKLEPISTLGKYTRVDSEDVISLG